MFTMYRTVGLLVLLNEDNTYLLTYFTQFCDLYSSILYIFQLKIFYDIIAVEFCSAILSKNSHSSLFVFFGGGGELK